MNKKFIFSVLGLFFSCVSAVFFICLLELSIRIVQPNFLKDKIYNDDINWYCTFDPTLGWKNRKSVYGTLASSRIHINNEGFRGSPVYFGHKTKKRVLILGDSIAFGYGVTDNETFSEILNRDVALQMDVINCGVLGYGPDQELLLYKKYFKKINPDVIILSICLANDFFDISSPRCIYDGGFLPKPVFLQNKIGCYSLYDNHIKLSLRERLAYELNYRSYLYNYIQYKINRNFQKERLKMLIRKTKLSLNYGTIGDKREKMMFLINQLNLLCKNNGHDLIVLIFPSGEMILRNHGYDNYSYLTKELVNNGIKFIDFYKELHLSKDNFFHYAKGDTFHLKLKGHYAVAEIIKDFILSHEIKN
jgi:lysophospholipase L1-like esterase